MNLTLDDLIGKCDECGGTGKRRPPGGRGGRQSITYTLDVRAEDCSKCRGTGRWGLTDAGRAVAELFTVLQKYDSRGHLYFLLHGDDDSSAI